MVGARSGTGSKPVRSKSSWESGPDIFFAQAVRFWKNAAVRGHSRRRFCGMPRACHASSGRHSACSLQVIDLRVPHLRFWTRLRGVADAFGLAAARSSAAPPRAGGAGDGRPRTRRLFWRTNGTVAPKPFRLGSAKRMRGRLSIEHKYDSMPINESEQGDTSRGRSGERHHVL